MMQSTTTRTTEPELGVRPRWGSNLATDEAGRLYNPDFRELLRRKFRNSPEALNDAEAMSAMVHAAKAAQESFDRLLESHNLTHQQYGGLMWIRAKGALGTKLNTIADWLRCSPRNITNLVDTLESQGLVERVPDPLDRRATIARVTEAGELRAQAASKAHHKATRSLMGVLTEEERETLRHISLKLLRALETEGADGRKANA